jgi:hypothetical protein
MYLRTADSGSLLQPGLAQTTPSNLVLISGGPGLLDPRDRDHDLGWSNYVDPPLIISRIPGRWASLRGAATQVQWLIYRPAYNRRWIDDWAHSRPSVAEVRSNRFDSYISLLEGRAQDRRWRLIWFYSAEQLWAQLASFRPIARVCYWGHGNDNLWLYVRHRSTDGWPMAPDETAVVRYDSINAHAGLRSRFVRGSPHRFVGCNTSRFAQEWSRVFNVDTEGFVGTVRFSGLLNNSGEPTLAPSARPVTFPAHSPQPVR